MTLSLQAWKLDAIRVLPPDGWWWTRRPVKEGERLVWHVYSIPASPWAAEAGYRWSRAYCDDPTVLTATNRLKWAEGHPLALVPGRGQKQVARATPAAIRLEHLQDITEEQAKLELVKSWPGISVLSATEMERGHSWRDGFFWLWDSIYAKQPTKQWFSNPQVWALGFRRSETVFVGEAK